MHSKTFPTPVEARQIQQLMDGQRSTFDALRLEALANGVDLMADRSRRYLSRWKEALAYVDIGAKVLDVGSGWVPPQIVDLIGRRYELNYHAYDIDPEIMDLVVSSMTKIGLPSGNFKTGEVSQLPFETGFDLVFSSHCLEHAVDIVGTLKEIRRVLKDGGSLFMSVPLGFDDSEEHLLFHGPSEWIEMLSAIGFEVVTHTIGTIYTSSSDLTILARHRDASPTDEVLAREIADRFSKAGRTLYTNHHPAFKFPVDARHQESHSIVHGIGTTFEVNLPAPPRALIIERHAWSGCLRISDGTSEVSVDAYSHVHHKQGIDLIGFGPSFEVEMRGRNPLSKGYECVVAGALI